MIPGFSTMAKQPEMDDAVTDKQLKRVEAIINSMTPGERQNPQIIDGRRKRRIAAGSGTTPAGDQPAAEPVPADAQDDEADDRPGRQGRHAVDAGMPGMSGMQGLPPGLR